MGTNNQKYDALLDKLRTNKPQPENADRLTNIIMKAVERMAMREQAHIIRVLRPILSTAAVLLIGLFFYQQKGETIPMQSSESHSQLKIEPAITSPCIAEDTIKNNEPESLLHQYICYIKYREIKNTRVKRLLLSQFSTYQNSQIVTQ